MAKKAPMSIETASELAIGALTFLAEDPARLSRFLSLSGMAPDELSRTAGEPATQAAIIEYLLGDESLLLVFAANAQVPPESLATARDLLAGPPPAWS